MLIITAGYLDSSRQADYNTIITLLAAVPIVQQYMTRTSASCKSCKLTDVVVCASREILIRMRNVAGCMYCILRRQK